MDIRLASILFLLGVSGTILALYVASLGLVPWGWHRRFSQGIALEDKTYLGFSLGVVAFYGVNHLFGNPIVDLARSTAVLMDLFFGVLLLIGGVPNAWHCFRRARLLNRSVRLLKDEPGFAGPGAFGDKR